MQRKKRSFVVVGLGAFGGTVATTLAGMGDEVLGIDNDERRVREHVDRITHVAIADARDEEALREAGAGQHDVAIVLLVSGPDDANRWVQYARHRGHS